MSRRAQHNCKELPANDQERKNRNLGKAEELALGDPITLRQYQEQEASSSTRG
jgi:hypothetical protein